MSRVIEKKPTGLWPLFRHHQELTHINRRMTSSGCGLLGPPKRFAALWKPTGASLKLRRDPNLRSGVFLLGDTGAAILARRAANYGRTQFARLFPESIIPGFATKHNAAVHQPDHFELVRHRGNYRCAGVQGSIAGFPTDVLIIDDPYKDHLEAHSLVVRENVWNNFRFGAPAEVAARWRSAHLLHALASG